jgi:hypothetical protein
MVKAQGLKALTFDVVSNPSHSSAVIYEFITEGENPLALIKDLEEHKSEVNEIIFEESETGPMQYNLEGEQVCACELDGSCVAGTIEESISYLIDRSLEKSTIKSFKFKI